MTSEPKYPIPPDAIDHRHQQPAWKYWTMPTLAPGPWVGACGATITVHISTGRRDWYIDHGSRPDGNADRVRYAIPEDTALDLLDLAAEMRRVLEAAS